eukprot:scaffold292_cov212-Pinguiococcus_pyrenoidosus.AAC.5
MRHRACSPRGCATAGWARRSRAGVSSKRPGAAPSFPPGAAHKGSPAQLCGWPRSAGPPSCADQGFPFGEHRSSRAPRQCLRKRRRGRAPRTPDFRFQALPDSDDLRHRPALLGEVGVRGRVGVDGFILAREGEGRSPFWVHVDGGQLARAALGPVRIVVPTRRHPRRIHVCQRCCRRPGGAHEREAPVGPGDLDRSPLVVCGRPWGRVVAFVRRSPRWRSLCVRGHHRWSWASSNLHLLLLPASSLRKSIAARRKSIAARRKSSRRWTARRRRIPCLARLEGSGGWRGGVVGGGIVASRAVDVHVPGYLRGGVVRLLPGHILHPLAARLVVRIHRQPGLQRRHHPVLEPVRHAVGRAGRGGAARGGGDAASHGEGGLHHEGHRLRSRHHRHHVGRGEDRRGRPCGGGGGCCRLGQVVRFDRRVGYCGVVGGKGHAGQDLHPRHGAHREVLGWGLVGGGALGAQRVGAACVAGC